MVACSAALLAGCQGALTFRSDTDRRVDGLLDGLENDTVAFELERPEALDDPEVRARFAERLFERTFELSNAALRESVGKSAPESDRLREAWLRCRGEFVRLGPAAAEQCVVELAGAGPRAGLARDLLTQVKPTDARDPIARALDSADAALRRAGIRAAMATNQVMAFETVLVAHTQDPVWTVRREAALALANATSRPARDALLLALDDRQRLVAREAAVALGRRRVRECGDALLRFLERAREARDPTSVDAALTAFHALSGRKDLGADVAAWRQWVIENRPIVDTRPSNEPPVP